MVLVEPSWAQSIEAWVKPLAAASVASTKHLLRWASDHTGLPVIVVAAVALVLAWRVARRTWHVALEVALAVGALLLATRLGWIHW